MAFKSYNIIQAARVRQKQMQYILDNLTEPDFSLIECPKQIADEFNMDDREVLNGEPVSRLGVLAGSSIAWNTESSQMVLFSMVVRICWHLLKQSPLVHLLIPSFVRPELGSMCPEHSSWTWSLLS